MVGQETLRCCRCHTCQQRMPAHATPQHPSKDPSSTAHPLLLCDQRPRLPCRVSTLQLLLLLLQPTSRCWLLRCHCCRSCNTSRSCCCCWFTCCSSRWWRTLRHLVRAHSSSTAASAGCAFLAAAAAVPVAPAAAVAAGVVAAAGGCCNSSLVRSWLARTQVNHQHCHIVPSAALQCCFCECICGPLHCCHACVA